MGTVTWNCIMKNEKKTEVSIVVQQAKPPLGALIQVLATLFPVQNTANLPGKKVEESWPKCVHSCHTHARAGENS